MQRLVLVVLLALGVASPALAQEEEAPRPLDSLTQKDIEREQQQNQWQGPSGFWTSPHRSEHGAYRYRLMGIGLVLMAGTGFLMWRLVRGARN